MCYGDDGVVCRACIRSMRHVMSARYGMTAQNQPYTRDPRQMNQTTYMKVGESSNRGHYCSEPGCAGVGAEG